MGMAQIPHDSQHMEDQGLCQALSLALPATQWSQPEPDLSRPVMS